MGVDRRVVRRDFDRLAQIGDRFLVSAQAVQRMAPHGMQFARRWGAA